MQKQETPVKYELTVILADGLSDEKKTSVLDNLKKDIKDAGGETTKEENLGQRALAYPIKKNFSGTYVVLYITLLPKKIADLDREIRFTNEIIRHLLVTELRFSVHQLKMMAARENAAETGRPERTKRVEKEVKAEVVEEKPKAPEKKEEVAPAATKEEEHERQEKLEKKLEEILKD